jgi:ADP-ribosyl-[dinitrogen reductase] hydrolase
MRLAPVPMFYFPNRNEILHFSGESSRTTHGAAECLDACRLLGDILFRTLDGENKEDLLLGTNPSLFRSEAVKEIAGGGYRKKKVSAIRGTGYVVHSLEAALWCFWNTASFEEAILTAANLGEDADTTAAVCGQIAGAFYGKTGIPEHWLNRLVKREEIERLAKALFEKKPALAA